MSRQGHPVLVYLPWPMVVALNSQQDTSRNQAIVDAIEKSYPGTVPDDWRPGRKACSWRGQKRSEP